MYVEGKRKGQPGLEAAYSRAIGERVGESFEAQIAFRALPCGAPSLVCISRALYTLVDTLKRPKKPHISSLLGGRELSAEKQHLNGSYQCRGPGIV